MSSSILHNPGQVMDSRLLRELTKELGGVNLKSLSRAESFQRHMSGGAVSYMNFQLREARNKIFQEENAIRREL